MPLTIPNIPVSGILKKSVAAFPNKPFILYPRRITFRELDTLTDKFATALADLGVGKGNTVGLFMWNSPEFITSFFGVLKTGATLTTLNPTYKEREAKHQLKDSESVAVIVEDEGYPIIKSIRGELPKLKNVIVVGGKYPETHRFEELIEKYPPNPPSVEIDPMEDLAVIPYAAGTYGPPRGCMLTHYNLVSNVSQVLNAGVGLKQDDIALAHLPFYHIYGMTVLILLTIHMGGSIVLQRRFDIAELLESIERHKVTVFPTVMPVISFLVDFPEFLKKYDLSSLRFVNNGAMSIWVETARRFQELTGVTVTQGYGLSETSPVTHLNPLNRIKIESVGPPVPDTEQKIVDLETGERELPVGEVGEIVVRGPQIMKGYWKNPEATAEVLKDGWLHTGDVGKIDKDGYLYITDRKKEIIKYKGFSIAPAELEVVLMEHPAVADCAVVGRLNLTAGEIPKAFVMLKGGASVTKKELIEFVGERVAGYKRIREVEFVATIPRSPEGKVLRKGFIERERERAGIR